MCGCLLDLSLQLGNDRRRLGSLRWRSAMTDLLLLLLLLLLSNSLLLDVVWLVKSSQLGRGDGNKESFRL